MAVVGEHCVDPVAQLGAQPDQLNPMPQHRPELTHRRWGDPRLGEQIRAQQLGEDVRVHSKSPAVHAFDLGPGAMRPGARGLSRCGSLL